MKCKWCKKEFNKDRGRMKEELADTIVCIAICLLIIIIVAIGYVFGYLNGEDSLIQKLCTKQQYDFCEVIEQEITMKEIKE